MVGLLIFIVTWDICAQPPGSSHCQALATDMTLGTSDLWLGTRTGAGGTATLA